MAAAPQAAGALVSWSASALVPATPPAVAAFVLRVRDLPAWNPAISGVRTTDDEARVGHPYSARIRGVIKATLTITSASVEEVTYVLEGTGFREIGCWAFRAAPGGGTVTTHSFEHSGAILRLMDNAFSEVAAWRVGRLRAVFAARGHTVP